MGIKAKLSLPFAKIIQSKTKKWSSKPIETQHKVFKNLINAAKNTAFGIDHHFNSIKTYDDFKRNVPIRNYEDLKPYINRILKGDANVTWPGKPLYLSKTSGTTSGAKYIPLTKDSIPVSYTHLTLPTTPYV